MTWVFRWICNIFFPFFADNLYFFNFPALDTQFLADFCNIYQSIYIKKNTKIRNKLMTRHRQVFSEILFFSLFLSKDNKGNRGFPLFPPVTLGSFCSFCYSVDRPCIQTCCFLMHFLINLKKASILFSHFGLEKEARMLQPFMWPKVIHTD